MGELTPPGGQWRGLCGAGRDRRATAAGEGAHGRDGSRRAGDIVLCRTGVPAGTRRLGWVVFLERLVGTRGTQSSPVCESAPSRETAVTPPCDPSRAPTPR